MATPGLASLGMVDFENTEQNVVLLDAGLRALLQFVHGQFSELYRALASQDQVVKARTLVDIACDAKPGESDREQRDTVGRAVILAGQLLAAQPNLGADVLA